MKIVTPLFTSINFHSATNVQNEENDIKLMSWRKDGEAIRLTRYSNEFARVQVGEKFLYAYLGEAPGNGRDIVQEMIDNHKKRINIYIPGSELSMVMSQLYAVPQEYDEDCWSMGDMLMVYNTWKLNLAIKELEYSTNRVDGMLKQHNMLAQERESLLIGKMTRHFKVSRELIESVREITNRKMF